VKKKILVMGSANVDFILKIPRFHKPGETIIGESFVTAFGGKGANQAMAAKRLGGRTGLLAKVGADPYGRSYYRYLTQNGFERKFLLVDEKIPTGIALIEVSSDGENRIIVSPGANGTLGPKDLEKFFPAFQEAGVFVAQLEIPIGSVLKGLKMAKKAGAATLLNPAPAHPIAQDLLPFVDYLTPNETEAEILTGVKIKKEKDIAAAAAKLLDRGVKNVVITLGGRGAFFKSRETEIWAEPFRVQPVDTTAAGDAFVGALACGLAEERQIPEILEFANAAGALATTKLGAQPSLPTLKEVERFLREKKGGKAKGS
jgi:ribokinase